MYTMPYQVPPFYIRGWKELTYPEVEQGSYMISSDGFIYSRIKNKILSPSPSSDSGYVRVTLRTSTGGTKGFRLHRLVAYEFCNPPENYEEMYINHIDNNRSNDVYTNLEWVTPYDNAHHAIDLGLFTPFPDRSNYTDEEIHKVCALLENPDNTINDIRRETGLDIPEKTVSDIRNGRSYTNISSQYNIPKKGPGYYNRASSDEEVHKFCQAIENKGDKTYKELARELGYPEDQVPKIAERMVELRKGISYRKITSQYPNVIKKK